MNWLRDGEVMALGWTLLHFCWQGIVIALLYVVANRAAGNASRNVRYGIGMATLALMPFVAVVTFIEQERLLVRVPRSGYHVVASQLGGLHDTVIRAVPFATSAVERSQLWIASNADRLLPWIVGIWLGGVLLLAARAAGGWWRLEQIRDAARNVIPAEVESSFHRVRTRLRMGRKVALYISDEVLSPLAMGIWHTAILLPVSAIVQLSPEQLEAVLAHEIAHIRRWDYLGNLLQTAMECLLFFHPAVWWISRRTRDLRELCCDEVAAGNCADPRIYVEALLQLESQRAKRLPLATALQGREGGLLERVKQLLGEEITPGREAMFGARIGVIGVVLLVLILSSLIVQGLRPIHDSTAASKHASINLALDQMRAATIVPIEDAYRSGIVRVFWGDSETTGFVAKSVNGKATIVTATYGSHGPFQVETWNHHVYPARIQKAGEVTYLQIDAPDLRALKPSTLTPDKGMAITGIGFAASRDLTVQAGTIRAVTGDVLRAGYDGVHTVLPGFGGSPIFDPSGNVVGIAYAFDEGTGNHIIRRYKPPA